MHLKTDKVDFKKAFFSKFFLSTHQVGMKNVVKCYKEFFGYFNALKTHCEWLNKVKIFVNIVFEHSWLLQIS